MQRPEKTRDKYFLATKVARISACLFFVVNASFSWAADPNDELVKLRKALTASTERQEEISGRLELLSGEIRALKEKSVQVAKKLTDLDIQMTETEDRLKSIQQVEKQTLETLAKQNKGLADTLSALLQLSRQPEGSLIGSPENLINNLRAATLLKAAIPALKKEADQLGGQLDTLANLRDQYLAEQQKFVDLRESRKSEREILNALLNTKKVAQTSLSNKNKKEARRQKELSLEARDLVALVARLEQEKQLRLSEERRRIEKEIALQEKLRREEIRKETERARRLAEQKAQDDKDRRETAAVPTPTPSRKVGATDKTPPKTDTVQKPKTTTLANISNRRPFSSRKGTLPLPVGGKIISKYSGAKTIGKRNGIVIETRGNAAVISPYDGQIAFAGPFRHYGLLLIIDHGEGYHTLLAGLGSIEGSVGQLLLAGEPVGQMKSSKSVKPTLYMELRVKGSPVNPIPWLAAENRKVSG